MDPGAYVAGESMGGVGVQGGEDLRGGVSKGKDKDRRFLGGGEERELREGGVV